MYEFLTDGMNWVPSPYPSPYSPGSITGVYLAPDESVEWFCLRDPGDGSTRVVGYAIRKKRPRRRKAPRLVCVK